MNDAHLSAAIYTVNTYLFVGSLHVSGPDGEPYHYTRPFCDNVNLSPYQLLQYRYYLTFVQVGLIEANKK